MWLARGGGPWVAYNLAEVHNSLVADPHLRYTAAWVNRTVYPDFSMHESTAYTSVVRLNATTLGIWWVSLLPVLLFSTCWAKLTCNAKSCV